MEQSSAATTVEPPTQFEPRSASDYDPRDGGARTAKCDAHALAATLANSDQEARLRAMVTAVARRRYGVHAVDAEDVFQDSVVTYLRIRNRYPADANHFGLFVGIFHRTTLTSLKRSRRRLGVLERLATRLAHAQRTPDPASAPDAAALSVERAAAIRAAVATLDRDAREALLPLAEGRHSRLDLIARLGINRNTFDSRLRVARNRLRRDLVAREAY
jgi:RNA polymerase sigma factor (sigma-70 family)